MSKNRDGEMSAPTWMLESIRDGEYSKIVYDDTEYVLLKHGHWDNKIIDGRFDVPHTVARCSNCKGKIWVYEENYVVKYPYCPMCGAKMDEVEE